MGLAEPSSRRKTHASKRRKLTRSMQSALLSTSSSFSSSVDIKVPVCTSCHRAFTGARRCQLVQCARCHEPTCTICSRTCNGCPPSVPPTPALTTSSSFSDDLQPPPSPRRPTAVLGASMANAPSPASGPPPHAVAGRRRKAREFDRDGEDANVCRDEGWCEAMEGVEDVLPGCGRVVCQRCSFETPQSDLTTCLDCAARCRGLD
ncbi:hypothetical protein C8Q79DRAFT_166735 [Trametes meyenii]|nr:hypothetical protein C8Q79DRAFT_166735 [Trametes meyenii]